eukprot:Clim_evm113s152 gene=Clim_evmTU113s152
MKRFRNLSKGAKSHDEDGKVPEGDSFMPPENGKALSRNDSMGSGGFKAQTTTRTSSANLSSLLSNLEHQSPRGPLGARERQNMEQLFEASFEALELIIKSKPEQRRKKLEKRLAENQEDSNNKSAVRYQLQSMSRVAAQNEAQKVSVKQEVDKLDRNIVVLRTEQRHINQLLLIMDEMEDRSAVTQKELLDSKVALEASIQEKDKQITEATRGTEELKKIIEGLEKQLEDVQKQWKAEAEITAKVQDSLVRDSERYREKIRSVKAKNVALKNANEDLQKQIDELADRAGQTPMAIRNLDAERRKSGSERGQSFNPLQNPNLTPAQQAELHYLREILESTRQSKRDLVMHNEHMEAEQRRVGQVLDDEIEEYLKKISAAENSLYEKNKEIEVMRSRTERLVDLEMEIKTKDEQISTLQSVLGEGGGEREQSAALKMLRDRLGDVEDEKQALQETLQSQIEECMKLKMRIEQIESEAYAA